MCLLDSIKRLLGYGDAKVSLSVTQISGLFVGGAIGEALGLPVVGKSEDQLSREPVTDLLGFSDLKSSAGTYSVCEESLVDFAVYISDNFDSAFCAGKFFSLCNSWYLIKAKDEDCRLKIILPCAALAGVFYASMKKNRKISLSSIPDILCDEAIAPASIVFYIFLYVSEGKKLLSACKKARRSTFRLLRKIGLQISQNNISIRILNIVTDCVTATNCYHNGVLKAINKGGSTDLEGNILGILFGLFYGLDNIPYFWRKFVGTQSNLIRLSECVVQMIGVNKS